MFNNKPIASRPRPATRQPVTQRPITKQPVNNTMPDPPPTHGPYKVVKPQRRIAPTLQPNHPRHKAITTRRMQLEANEVYLQKMHVQKANGSLKVPADVMMEDVSDDIEEAHGDNDDKVSNRKKSEKAGSKKTSEEGAEERKSRLEQEKADAEEEQDAIGKTLEEKYTEKFIRDRSGPHGSRLVFLWGDDFSDDEDEDEEELLERPDLAEEVDEDDWVDNSVKNNILHKQTSGLDELENLSGLLDKIAANQYRREINAQCALYNALVGSQNRDPNKIHPRTLIEKDNGGFYVLVRVADCDVANVPDDEIVYEVGPNVHINIKTKTMFISNGVESRKGKMRARGVTSTRVQNNIFERLENPIVEKHNSPA